MYRRTRRKTGMWLPPSLDHKVTGSPQSNTITSVSEGALGAFNQDLAILGAAQYGSTIWASVPLVGDLKQNTLPGAAAGDTMADFAFGYSLKRIVGKIFCSLEQFRFSGVEPDGLRYARDFVCTAGIMVRRVDINGLPVVALAGPQVYDTWTDPWVWRRSWMLLNQPQALVYPQDPYFASPSSNMAYGSVLDGPHVDAKTRRTIKSDERLFMTFQTTCVDDGVEGADFTIRTKWVYDLRYFGRVFQSAGNRRNASR